MPLPPTHSTSEAEMTATSLIIDGNGSQWLQQLFTIQQKPRVYKRPSTDTDRWAKLPGTVCWLVLLSLPQKPTTALRTTIPIHTVPHGVPWVLTHCCSAPLCGPLARKPIMTVCLIFISNFLNTPTIIKRNTPQVLKRQFRLHTPLVVASIKANGSKAGWQKHKWLVTWT